MKNVRQWKTYQHNDLTEFRNSLLAYTNQFGHFQFLDSCNNSVYGKLKFKCILAAGNKISITENAGNACNSFKIFLEENNDWCFGYFGYDLKNEIEKLQSANPDFTKAKDLIFFVPEILILVGDEIQIGIFGNDHDEIYHTILHKKLNQRNSPALEIKLKPRISKNAYLQKVEEIRSKIIEGDLYEMNLCQEFYAESVTIDPQFVFDALCSLSKAPFSVFFRWDDLYLISASPERFLKKSGNKIISQPIKGTAARNADPVLDKQMRDRLVASEKDKAENVMIVDLVRNDFARSCKTGSIKVDELFGIYSFEQVHQMVSTISGELKDNIHPVDILKNTFPMGSMTGAPKIMAMQLIEAYEETKRGIYSGSTGYFTPPKGESDASRDFDLNVVIRSLIYNSTGRYISAHVGGAITFDSVAEAEYAECLVKLSGLQQALITGGA